MKVLHSICQQTWKTQQCPQDWKTSVFIPIPKKGNAKKRSNYHTFHLISHVSKVMLKILQADFNRMWTINFQMFKLNLEKTEKLEIKLPTSVGSLKKQDSSRKYIYFCFIDYSKAYEKFGLKLNIQKTKIMVSGPIIHGNRYGNIDRLYFYFFFNIWVFISRPHIILGLQNHCRWWLQPQN